MDRTITIDHPYQRITLDFDVPHIKRVLDQMAPTLTEQEWAALERAEQNFYRGTGAPTLGWTDVNMREDSGGMLADMWSHTRSYVANEVDDESFKTDEQRENAILHRTARRMCQTIAIMAFGADVLLK